MYDYSKLGWAPMLGAEAYFHVCCRGCKNKVALINWEQKTTGKGFKSKIKWTESFRFYWKYVILAHFLPFFAIFENRAIFNPFPLFNNVNFWCEKSIVKGLSMVNSAPSLLGCQMVYGDFLIIFFANFTLEQFFYPKKKWTNTENILDQKISRGSILAYSKRF